MRFSVAWIGALTAALSATMAFSATAAHAQSAPAATTAPATALARIEDIQIAREGETISILVKLSAQPSAATAKTTEDTLQLDIDGLTLAPLYMTPSSGSLVTQVEAGAKRLTLAGAAFEKPTTVIYRNAILIEARLAPPPLRAGSSLMTPQRTPAALTPVVPPTPVAATAAPAPKPSEPDHGLESHPAPAARPAPVKAPAVQPSSTAALAGINAPRCTAAAAELAKDAWALPAMGDHALCLLDADKIDEAKNRLDQLAAITPQDWRVALGRAALSEKSGDAIKAQEGYVAASLAAPNDTIRAAITARIAPVAEAPVDIAPTAHVDEANGPLRVDDPAGLH